jgi:putative DNA-invertase from lambdoid prophage Rac
MARTFAYCRVSTTDQTTENQVQEISSAGFTVETHRVVTEAVSGSTQAAQRPGFAKLLDRLEPDDVLIVTKLDRLGRDAIDLMTTVRTLAERGVRVHCLALGGVDLTSPAGKMVMGVVSAMAEFERDLIVERTKAGLARARAAGKTVGRPASLTADQCREIASRRAQGESLATLAKAYGVSRAGIQRAERKG